MICMQLDLFEETSESDCLREEIRVLRASHEKIRKSLYARHGALAKMYCDLNSRMNILERNICTRGIIGYERKGSALLFEMPKEI